MAYKEVSVKQPLLLTILPYVSIIIFFAFWEGVVRSGIIPNTLLASPSQVFAAFIDKLSNPNPDGAIMATHAWTSIQEAFIGYVLSLVVGIPLGLAMGWFNVVEGLFRPIFELIRPIPPIAWIPISIIWFGLGETPKIFLITLAAFANTTLNAMTGAENVDITTINAAKMLGANEFQIFITVVIPASVPSIFAGLQVGISCAWASVVAAEMVKASNGLGWIIQAGMDNNNMTQILSGIIMIGLGGFVLTYIMRTIEGVACRWNKSGR